MTRLSFIDLLCDTFFVFTMMCKIAVCCDVKYKILDFNYFISREKAISCEFHQIFSIWSDNSAEPIFYQDHILIIFIPIFILLAILYFVARSVNWLTEFRFSRTSLVPICDLSHIVSRRPYCVCHWNATNSVQLPCSSFTIRPFLRAKNSWNFIKFGWNFATCSQRMRYIESAHSHFCD